MDFIVFPPLPTPLLSGSPLSLSSVGWLSHSIIFRLTFINQEKALPGLHSRSRGTGKSSYFVETEESQVLDDRHGTNLGSRSELPGDL